MLEEQIKLSNEQCESYKKQNDSTESKCRQLEDEIAAKMKTSSKEMEELREELLRCRSEMEKLVTDNKCARLEDALKREKEEVKGLKRQLREMRMSVNESILSQEAAGKDRDSRHENEVKRLQDKLSCVAEEKENLKKRLKEAVEKDSLNKIKVIIVFGSIYVVIGYFGIKIRKKSEKM